MTMAEDKKSFIVYVDWKETFDSLPDDKAGQLIKHLFAYVSDEDPKSDDILINAVFVNIKQQLKRDLKKWEGISSQRSDIGRLGGIKSGEARQSKTKQTKQLVKSGSKTKQNEHDICNMLNDNDTVIVKEKKKKEFIPPSLLEFETFFEESGYSKDSAKKAFEHYELGNWHDVNGKPVLNWKQKVHMVWFKDENKINGNKPKFVF